MLLSDTFFTKGFLSSNPVEALAAYARNLAITEKLAEANPDVWKYQDYLARTHNNIAGELAQLGRLSETLASRRRRLRSGNERLMPTPRSQSSRTTWPSA